MRKRGAHHRRRHFQTATFGLHSVIDYTLFTLTYPMKRIFLSGLLLLAILLPLSGQIGNSKAAFVQIKRSKVILGLSGNEELDNALRTAVDSFWTYARLDGELPLKEAYAKAQKDDRLVVLAIDKRVSEISISRPGIGANGMPDYAKSN